MTSKIKDKIYQLITQADNFEFAYDLNSNFDSIKERIIDEFWEDVISSLKDRYSELIIKEESEEIKLSSKKFKGISFFLGLYDYEDFQQGLCVEYNGTKKMQKIIEDEFIDLFDDDMLDGKDSVFWFYETKNENFQELASLKKILPENRKTLIDKYISDFDRMYNTYLGKIIDFSQIYLSK